MATFFSPCFQSISFPSEQGEPVMFPSLKKCFSSLFPINQFPQRVGSSDFAYLIFSVKIQVSNQLVSLASREINFGLVAGMSTIIGFPINQFPQRVGSAIPKESGCTLMGFQSISFPSEQGEPTNTSSVIQLPLWVSNQLVSLASRESQGNGCNQLSYGQSVVSNQLVSLASREHGDLKRPSMACNTSFQSISFPSEQGAHVYCEILESDC